MAEETYKEKIWDKKEETVIALEAIVRISAEGIPVWILEIMNLNMYNDLESIMRRSMEIYCRDKNRERFEVHEDKKSSVTHTQRDIVEIFCAHFFGKGD